MSGLHTFGRARGAVKFARADLDAALLQVPDLMPVAEKSLTRAEVCALEAIHLLTLGLDRACADELAAVALARRSWNCKLDTRQFGSLVRQGLVDRDYIPGWNWIYRLTAEGRVEHQSARAEVFA